MNWLIYTMYARMEYKFCKEIIAQQLEENYDQEYLFFIKVSNLYMKFMLSIRYCFSQHNIREHCIPAFDNKFCDTDDKRIT